MPNVGGFGDWLNLGGGASPEVIDTAYYAYLRGMMAEMARAIGQTPTPSTTPRCTQDIEAAFAAVLHARRYVQDSSQTGYALAFTMDLVPAELRDKAAAKFADEIERFHWHLATGFIGTPRLLPGPAPGRPRRRGLPPAAAGDLSVVAVPGETGATTMWERWDGWTPDVASRTIGMNSFNHYAFGAVGEYLYGAVGGIRAERPVTRRSASSRSARGLSGPKRDISRSTARSACRWKPTARALSLTVDVPPPTRRPRSMCPPVTPRASRSRASRRRRPRA